MIKSNMTNQDRILHAGLHKTGSTFLQRELFPIVEGVNYIGDYNLRGGAVINDINKPILFSNEASCGYPYPVAKPFDSRRIETNINVLMPNKIILVSREFYEWVLSLYFQTLNSGYSWDLDEYIKKNKDGLLSWRNVESQIKVLCNNLGIQYLILRYEDLQADHQKFCDEICAYIGCKSISTQNNSHNASLYGNKTIETYRFLNKVNKINLIKRFTSFTGCSPRNLMQRGKIGRYLDQWSSRYITAQDVEKLFG